MCSELNRTAIAARQESLTATELKTRFPAVRDRTIKLSSMIELLLAQLLLDFGFELRNRFGYGSDTDTIPCSRKSLFT